jgi:GR25 family glycosyltransferase involved in LPS biosynthesis
MLPRIWVLTVDREIQRFNETAKHLDSLGIKWERFNGFDNERCELSPIRTFDLDRAGERIGKKHVAACLSHYLVWKVMEYQPDESFIVAEYDARFPDNYRERLRQIAEDLPDDWQVCFLGNCCTKGRPTTHIKGDIYEVHFPLCGHCIWWRKTALPTLLKECQSIYMPLDIHLFTNVLPKLRTYTVLPPLVTQAGTPLPP